MRVAPPDRHPAGATGRAPVPPWLMPAAVMHFAWPRQEVWSAVGRLDPAHSAPQHDRPI